MTSFKREMKRNGLNDSIGLTGCVNNFVGASIFFTVILTAIDVKSFAPLKEIINLG